MISWIKKKLEERRKRRLDEETAMIRADAGITTGQYPGRYSHTSVTPTTPPQHRRNDDTLDALLGIAVATSVLSASETSSEAGRGDSSIGTSSGSDSSGGSGGGVE